MSTLFQARAKLSWSGAEAFAPVQTRRRKEWERESIDQLLHQEDLLHDSPINPPLPEE